MISGEAELPSSRDWNVKYLCSCILRSKAGTQKACLELLVCLWPVRIPTKEAGDHLHAKPGQPAHGGSGGRRGKSEQLLIGENRPVSL